MKRALAILSIVAAGLAAAVTIRYQLGNAARYEAHWKSKQEQWERDRADLQARLNEAEAGARQARNPIPVPPAIPAQDTKSPRPDPSEIIADIQKQSMASGLERARRYRAVVYGFEQLSRCGQEALPAIRAYLRQYEDVDLDVSPFEGRGERSKVPLDFVVPPTIRFGLFDVLRRLGGEEAQIIMREALQQTGRGAEVFYLAQALQEMAPNTFRDELVNVARALLAQPDPDGSASAIDRHHRNYLYAVLTLFGDAGYANEAQSQLLTADHRIDPGALRYLKQTLGAGAVPIVAQAYQNAWLTNSAGKEPLARVALSYVGADSQANAFYEQAINDPLLTRSHRKNLIEDLNQDGFADTGNLTANDLHLIENRISLILQLAPSAMDDVNAAAFQEAYKDLVNMRAKILGSSSAPQ